MNIIYTDMCNEKSKIIIETSLNKIVKIRSPEWNLEYIIKTITDPQLELVVINKIDEKSISEIAMSAFLCKKILVTSPEILNYGDSISDFVNYTEFGANLRYEKNTFISWYNHINKGSN